MALHQKIQVMKFMAKLFELQQTYQISRSSILDGYVLLTVNEHKSIGKMEMTHEIYGTEQNNKSSIDRPCARLCRLGLLTKKENPHADAKGREPRAFYELSDKGEQFLKECY